MAERERTAAMEHRRYAVRDCRLVATADRLRAPLLALLTLPLPAQRSVLSMTCRPAHTSWDRKTNQHTVSRAHGVFVARRSQEDATTAQRQAYMCAATPHSAMCMSTPRRAQLPQRRRRGRFAIKPAHPAHRPHQCKASPIPALLHRATTAHSDQRRWPCFILRLRRRASRLWLTMLVGRFCGHPLPPKSSLPSVPPKHHLQKALSILIPLQLHTRVEGRRQPVG